MKRIAQRVKGDMVLPSISYTLPNTGPDLISGWEYSDCASDRRKNAKNGNKFFRVIYFSSPPRIKKNCFFLSRNISIKPPFNNNKLRKFQQVVFCVSSSINLMRIMLHVIPFRHRTQREKSCFSHCQVHAHIHGAESVGSIVAGGRTQ